MENKKFYKCNICGNVIEKIIDSGVPVVCCGQKMDALKLETEDTHYEKHKPVVTVDGNKVKVVVGSTEHPMVPEHFIDWIYLETIKGSQKKVLSHSDKPVVEFILSEKDQPLAVYSNCNIHGLWYVEV